MQQRLFYIIFPLLLLFVSTAIAAAPMATENSHAPPTFYHNSVEMPPATYYGWVLPNDPFAPSAGTAVIAWIDGVNCGAAAVTELDGQLAYSIQVRAESVLGPPDGCGAADRVVHFEVAAVLMDNSSTWDNSQAWQHDLTLTETTSSQALSIGWQLIALPLVNYNTPIATALAANTGNYDLTYAYEAETATWQRYAPAGPPFGNTLLTVDPTVGLWLHVTLTGTLTITGTTPITTAIPLVEGWNLIGLPIRETQPIADVLASVAGDYDLVYGYKEGAWLRYAPDGPPFGNSLSQITPTSGYWIHATSATSLLIDNR